MLNILEQLFKALQKSTFKIKLFSKGFHLFYFAEINLKLECYFPKERVHIVFKTF